MKKVSLASTLADAVYYLIWLLFLPQIIDALQMEGLSPVKEMVGQILGFLPSLFGALIIFFLFYVVSRIVQRLATSLLATVGFDRLPEWLGLGAARTGAGSASAVAGYVILAILLFLGAVQAFKTLGLETVSSLAEQLLAGLFNIVVAVVIFGVGLFLSRIAYKTISPTGAGPVGAAGQHRPRRDPDLHRRHGALPRRAGLGDRDPRLRGGDRGARPRRRPRLRPGRTRGGGEDHRRLAREVLTP